MPQLFIVLWIPSIIIIMIMLLFVKNILSKFSNELIIKKNLI